MVFGQLVKLLVDELGKRSEVCHLVRG
jgi:hypothetical protein